jgi:signal transduction histidine kinase
MPRLGMTIRAFVALFVGAIPPLVLLLAVVRADPDILQSPSFGLLAVGILSGAVAWAAVVATLAARALGLELRNLVTLASRGGAEAGELDIQSRRLADSLDERNRQVAELAAQAQSAPISDDPRLVARHVVDTVRSVTADDTWHLAILDSSNKAGLPPGIYGAGDGSLLPPNELTDLHRWASVAESDGSVQRVRRAEGPWGAFVMVEVAAHDQLRAILLAPWEGRAQPSTAELDLLSLVGQHAATAIEHALLYATVRQQADELDRMGAIQRDFLRAVSHDLQTPLASIRALAGELRSDPSTDEGSARDLDLIEHQADRLRRMVQQLLAMSRLEAGVLTPRQEVLAPRPLVERTWAALRAADRALDLRLQEPPLLLVADPDRLEQVLWAVLDNAIKYSPPATPIHVEIGPAKDDGTRGRITVRDEGPGMDPETIGHAFDQFYRASQARRLAPDGSGIGLYTARGLVETMGGLVRLESVLGQGTAVILELPSEPVEEPANVSTGSVPVPPQG